MTPRARRIGGVVASAAALVLGALAVWPIYESGWVWLVALVALVCGTGIAWAAERWRLGFPVVAALTLGLFTVTVVPVAVPQSLSTGPLRGLGDGLAAVALGWKQLLTLDLPVGTYQSVLVPAYVVMLLTALLVGIVAQRPGRWAALAAVPMLAPVAFGTIFGAAAVSAPVTFGRISVIAPREIALWLAAAVLGCAWVAWTSGAERRAALRLGRETNAGRVRRDGAARVATAAGVLVIALVAGLLLAPALDSGTRSVARDRIDPELVVRDQPSPLAAYRNTKHDAMLDAPLFSVAADGALPERLRLAVLDAYDGIDFHVSDDAAGRFTRFPSGDPLTEPSSVTIEVLESYGEIWVPTARLGAPPKFTGPRAPELADAFYVNRRTGAAIDVPRGDTAGSSGLAEGDGYTAEMETANPSSALGAPIAATPLIDLEQLPETGRWIERQGVSAEAGGVELLIDLLRERGYLSHSMSRAEGELEWLERLNEQYGTTFESSPGGHSFARVETLFSQLNTQQALAGPDATPRDLVAGIGDDEQFAAAAALLARALGYESRVVIGVRLAGDEVPGVPQCDTVCTGEHVAAWIEVRGESGEWVAFDTTPQLSNPPQRLEQGEQLPEFPTTPEERDAQEVDPPIGLGDQSDGSNTENETSADPWIADLLRAVGLSVLALLLLLLPFLFLPVAKRVRAKRRRTGEEPELRALGAWEEMVDRARDAGVEIPGGASRSEIATAIGGAHAARIAAQVDRAVFSAGSIDAAGADELWRTAEVDSAERRSALSTWRRLSAAYSLRSYGIRFTRRSRCTESERTG